METILRIEEVTEGKSYSTMSGYRVVTEQQDITLLIDDNQNCCEQWGYFWCNDDPDEFIGAKLLDVTVSDTELNEAMMESDGIDLNSKWFEGGIMFVNLETDRGTLQFVAYNEHNGYYGHEAKVSCKQLDYAEYL